MSDPNVVSITLDSTGCAAMVSLGAAGQPRRCHGEPTHAGFTYNRWPRVRLFACSLHADELRGSAPLTDEDRAELAAKQWQELQALAGKPYVRVQSGEDYDNEERP